MSNHTSAPWHVVPPQGGLKPVVQRGREGGFVIHGTSPERELSDAYLIAAAPDLLKALKGLYDSADSAVHLTPDKLIAAAEAVSKAEGNS